MAPAAIRTRFAGLKGEMEESLGRRGGTLSEQSFSSSSSPVVPAAHYVEQVPAMVLAVDELREPLEDAGVGE
jgi:hypothetical protein